jgi:hypothetical protein
MILNDPPFITGGARRLASHGRSRDNIEKQVSDMRAVARPKRLMREAW